MIQEFESHRAGFGNPLPQLQSVHWISSYSAHQVIAFIGPALRTLYLEWMGPYGSIDGHDILWACPIMVERLRNLIEYVVDELQGVKIAISDNGKVGELNEIYGDGGLETALSDERGESSHIQFGDFQADADMLYHSEELCPYWDRYP